MSDVSRVPDRLHIELEPRAWRLAALESGREEYVICPEGLLIVSVDPYAAVARPPTRADLAAIFPTLFTSCNEGIVELACRIPWALLRQAEAFFRAVWAREKREDVLLLYYDEEKQRYELVHPRLISASSGHVDCEHPETPPAAVRFGSFHSHPHEATHSWIDADDHIHSPGLHVILGNLEAVCESCRPALPSLSCVWSTGAHCFPVHPATVFETPTLPVFPEAWFQPLVSSKSPQARRHHRGFSE